VLLRRRESETKIGFFRTGWWRWNLPPWNVSSVSPSSEWVEELWGVVGLYESAEELCHWWKYGHMNLRIN